MADHADSTRAPELGLAVVTPTEAAPIVKKGDGKAVADSRDVATFFTKAHFQVLRDIRNLIAKEPELGQSNFVSFKTNDLTGESTSHYEMDRDGFTLLAMGFTGEKALKWKRRYIEAFNKMEAELRGPRLVVDPSDPKVMLAVFDHLQKAVAERDAKISVQGQKLKKLDRIEASGGSMCISTAAKTLGVDPIRKLFELLQARRWIFKRPNTSDWVAHQDKIRAGMLEHADHLYLDSQKREQVRSQVKVTAKGLVAIAELLNQPMH